VYRACGYRVGWVSFSGAVDRSERYMSALDLLAALRLCSNVPGSGPCRPRSAVPEHREALLAGRPAVSHRARP
jgi:alanine-synthesizing transaminase